MVRHYPIFSYHRLHLWLFTFNPFGIASDRGIEGKTHNVQVKNDKNDNARGKLFFNYVSLTDLLFSSKTAKTAKPPRPPLVGLMVISLLQRLKRQVAVLAVWRFGGLGGNEAGV